MKRVQFFSWIFLIQEQREHVNTSVETLEKGAGVGKDST